MSAQIEALKQQLSYGGYLQTTQGAAESGWGLGTSPYAVEPAPAAAEHQLEDRQGDESLGDTQATDFEPLYAPEDYAHGFSSEEQLHGELDLTQPPQKMEEVRSAPEDQEALVEYANVIGAYAEGEEAAIQREQVPLEYQEMVRLYFDQLQQEAAAEDGEGDAAETEGEPDQEPDEEPATEG